VSFQALSIVFGFTNRAKVKEGSKLGPDPMSDPRTQLLDSFTFFS
jgi:hypothetical protein